MKKSEKIKLAVEVIEKCKTLGITIKKDGFWLLLEPPSLVKPEMLIEISKCSNEISDRLGLKII